MSALDNVIADLRKGVDKLRAGILGAADALDAAAAILDRESENYRDGNTYQPNGNALRRAADAARKAERKARQAVGPGSKA